MGAPESAIRYVIGRAITLSRSAFSALVPGRQGALLFGVKAGRRAQP